MVKELLCCVTPVITVRNSSCGKVMFLKVSVCPQGKGVSQQLLPSATVVAER